MGYKEILSKIVADSGLTLRNIADKCRVNDKPIDPSYISKLQTGKQGPPSEEISKAIAEACGADPNALVLEGFMEKAPQPIQDFVYELLEFLKRITADTFEMSFSKEAATMIRDRFNELSLLELLREIRETLPQGENLFSLENNNFPQLGISPNVGFPVIDNSMAPLLPQGSRAHIIIDLDYNNADIVALNLPDKTFLIRRIVYQNDQVLLIPENKRYEVLTLPKDEVEIVGRITSVTVDL